MNKRRVTSAAYFLYLCARKKTPDMGRVMAIDYGQKRVGFAVTDELQICAHALETVPVAQAFDFLKDYLSKERVDVIVIGEARQLDNTPSESCRYIEPFVNRLRKELPKISPATEIARMDERFTSRIAFQTMIDIGMKKKDRQNKANVDKMSAAIILQSYLEQQDLVNLRNNEQ
jgi:putative Holliday junction resolvase